MMNLRGRESKKKVKILKAMKSSKEDIMLTLQRMMNLPGRELKKKVNIL